MSTRWAWAAVVALSAGCWEHQRGFMALDEEEALHVAAPTRDRCAKFAKGSAELSGCEQLKQTAMEWTRHLNSGDEICLDNYFGEEPGGKCKARGVLVDSGSEGFTIEVRDAQVESRWINYNQRKVWFATGAMIDQYLKERGYE